MKRFKMLAPAIVATLAIISFSAFKMIDNQEASNSGAKFATSVFTLNPSGDPDQASDYSYSPSGTSCTTGSQICAVGHEGDNTLTQAELDAILDGTDKSGQIYRKN